MLPKEILWVGAKGGLIAEKHYYAMRDAIWLFEWLLLRQTGLSENGEGVVNYGHPITRREISEDTGFADSRIERWTDRLRRTDYIRTEKSGKDGLVFWIQAAKHKSKRAQVAAKMLPVEPPPTTKMLPRHKNAASQPTENKRISLVGGAPIPKSLSYYNKDAAAKASAVISSLSRKTKPERQESEQEIRARVEQQKQVLREKGFLQ